MKIINIGRAKRIVYRTNPTVGRATAHLPITFLGPCLPCVELVTRQQSVLFAKKMWVAIATEVTRFCFVLLKLQFCLVTFSLHVLLSITWWPLPRLNKFRELPTNCLRRNVHCTKHTSSHTNCTCSPELLWQLTGRTHGIPNSVHLNLIVDTKIGQNKHV